MWQGKYHDKLEVYGEPGEYHGRKMTCGWVKSKDNDSLKILPRKYNISSIRNSVPPISSLSVHRRVLHQLFGSWWNNTPWSDLRKWKSFCSLTGTMTRKLIAILSPPLFGSTSNSFPTFPKRSTWKAGRSRGNIVQRIYPAIVVPQPFNARCPQSK